MRVNEPIIDREIEVREGQVLVSRTDPESKISFVNSAFVEVSGFDEAELLNQRHNLVRHPHMPKEAFADLWATIKAGRAWDGLVKNRAKSGAFYWVRANVTPLVEDGVHQGYISIRTRPDRADVAAAEQSYAALRHGKSGVEVKDGVVRATGLGPRLAVLAGSISGRLALSFIVMIVMMLGISAVNLIGLADTSESLRTVYEDRTVPAGQLADINDAMHMNNARLTALARELAAGNKDGVARISGQIDATIAHISKTWSDYMATFLTDEEKVLAAKFAEARGAFVRDGLRPAMKLAAQGDAANLESHLRTVPPMFTLARNANAALIQLQLRVASELNAAAVAGFHTHLAAAGVALAVAILAAIGFAAWLLAGIRRPLRAIERHFDAIAQGNFSAGIPLPAAYEFHSVVRLLRAMRARLMYSIEERAERERHTAVDRRAAVQAMANKVETDTRHAVEQVSRQTSEMADKSREMTASAARVSDNATSVAAAAEQALANAQAVGAASEQLTASINEIASQVAQASSVAQRAVDGGDLAQQRIRSLSESATRIGDVVQLISSIAAQTNLLALNATIEAARAGDAGKGFAVVASEVKNLATQTARSTDEISRQIAEIQTTTGAVVEVVSEIGSRITEIAQVSVAVAAAVEQQAGATQEIARNVAQTGSAAQEVSQRIAEVSADATRTGSQAAAMQRGTDAIAATIGNLSGSIVQAIRTATADADRRLQERHTINKDCIVALGGSAGQAATLYNISRGGAQIHGLENAAQGQTGRLTADALGSDCHTQFTVAEIPGRGIVRIVFVDDTISAGLVRVLYKLENHGHPSAYAA